MINFYRITVFAVLLWSAMQARAQSVFYQFSKSTSTYADLASPTMLTTTMMTNFEVMPVPAGLKAFNVALPSSFKVGKNGWIVCTGPTRSFAFNPFLAALSATATTTVGYKLEASGQDSVLKIEWKNVVPANGTPGETLSFQLWFHKKSQTIEFHYGPSNVTTAVKPALQIALLSPDFVSAEYEIHSLSGNFRILKDSLSGDTLIVHDGMPPNGAVYRFTHPSTSITELRSKDFRIFPNPANDVLYVDIPHEVPFTLTDAVGRRVATGRCSAVKGIDTRGLAEAVYTLTIGTGDQQAGRLVQIMH